MPERWKPAVCVVMAGLFAAAPAARAEDRSQSAGDSLGALPGVARVGVAGPLARGTSVSAFAGYGFASDVLPEGPGDRHHRALSQLAVTLRLVDWLGFGVRLDGRYDKHVDVDEAHNEDDGWVGDPRLLARASSRFGEYGLGGQLSVWFPGGDAPSVVPEATSVDALLLGSYAPSGSPFTLSGNLGFRLDQSAASVDDPMALSLADRMALGASDSHAVLVGLGGTYRAGGLELLGEWTWDLLVGGDAPSPSESPMRVTGGARLGITDTLAGQVLVDFSLAGTPPIGAMAALVPIEPRVSAMAGLHYRFATGAEVGEGELLGEEDQPPPPPPEPEPEPAILEGRVLSGGQPIPNARVTVERQGAGEPARVTTDEEGAFRLPELEPGAVKVSASADGYQDASESMRLGEGATRRVELVLEQEHPPGQLRGVVRSIRGEVLEAKLTVEPIGVESETDEDGVFEIDLPPGEYEVVIEARGHARQRQSVQIEQDGVTIINADMKPRR